MKRREGDHGRGSTGPQRAGLGRVVLGATLVLAGDAARDELTPDGASDPTPPRQAAKARRTTTLPQPRFAATEAPAAKLAAPELRTRKVLRAPALAAQPETDETRKAPSPPGPVAPPVPAVAEPAGGVLSAEYQSAVLNDDIRNNEAKTVNKAVPTEEAGSKTNLAQFEHPTQPDQAANNSFTPPQPPPLAASPEEPEPKLAQAQRVPAPAPAPVPAPAPASPELQPVPAPTAVAQPPAPLVPVEIAENPKPQAAPTMATAQTAPPQLEAPAAAPVAPTEPSAEAGPKPSLLANLPTPAFGGPEPAVAANPAPKAASPAQSTPKPIRLAALTPPAPQAPLAALASPPAAPTPRHLASRNFAERRADLPQPAFGLAQTRQPAGPSPVALPQPALTAPIAANGSPAPGLGVQGPVPVISEDDELILQIETPQGEMSDTVVAYGLRQGVYLPLGALTRFFDLAISVSDDGHYASGWFLNEKRTITLNLRDGTLLVAGRAVPLGRGDAVAYEGELYLRAERFSDLFPLDLKVDLRAQTIAVKTREPFPFEERMAREASRERLGSHSASGSTQRFVREETPWRALSTPLGEVELRALTDDDLGARVEGDFRLAGDLAFMTARAYASLSSRDGLTAARFELGRRDPDADLLGPLKATEFQLGDVSTGALPIGLRGISGRGAFVTNAPLEQASIFDSVDLRGDLADGYEVELYRNNTLIGSTRTPVNGQYAFLQVPVDFGLNVFRLVFFGPQGQRREVVRRISVGDGRLSPGQFVYSVGAAQKDVNLLAVRGPQFSPAADYGAWRTTAELGYGLSRAVTATLGAGLWQSGGRHHWLATTGLRSGVGATALRLDLGVQDRGGHTIELGVGGKLLGMAYSLNHAEYGGGASDEVRAFTADPLRRATELNLNTTLHFGSGPAARAMPLTSQVRRTEYADGRRQTNAALRASLPLGSVLLSNTFDYNALSAPGTAASHRLLGTFDLATLTGSRTRFRASLGYGLAPKAELQSATIEADRRFGASTMVRAGVTHTLADHQTSLGLSAVRRIGPVNLAFDGSYGFPTRNFSLALRLGFSFGRNPLDGRLFMARPGLTSGGAVAVRAFADANGNGRFDPGEAPVPDVTFLSGTEESRSNAAGRTLIGNLGDGNRASIRVDADSMPDIALAPARPGVEIVPRPGRIHVSDFAIVTLSDIEGTAYFRAESGTRAVSRLQLRLLRADGTVASRTRSESDGFFLFERLPAGEYRLELDPQQAATLKIRLEAPVVLTLGGKASVLRKSIYVKSAQ